MTAAVRVSGLTKSFPGSPPVMAVDDVDFEIAAGEFLVLLGPSGCGKTTTLRCLAGLESPGSGSISLGDQLVYHSEQKVDRPPNERSIGMVFQSYALWPHMSVRRNIEFPLKARKLKQGLSEDWAGHLAGLVDCSELLERYPGQLSGGQQQRVALARGLVARPDLVLFDEPLSNLDARLRDQVRNELHELHRQLAYTAVYVTHDQSEALALGDRLAIMRKGKIEQLDTPTRVYSRPASEYVAGFIGLGNRLVLERSDGQWTSGGEVVSGVVPGAAGREADIVLRMRPEDLSLHRPDEVPDRDLASFTCTFVDATYGGDTRDVVVTVAGDRLTLRIRASRSGHWVDDLDPGVPVRVGFSADAVVAYDADGVLLDLARPERSTAAVAG